MSDYYFKCSIFILFFFTFNNLFFLLQVSAFSYMCLSQKKVHQHTWSH